MSKAILASIKPKYCNMIMKGLKSIEVRKTRPKLETPFKVYIYCTKQKGFIASGQVIGEFICDRIETYRYIRNEEKVENEAQLLASSLLSPKELYGYLKGTRAYGWHISELKIYEKPKELSCFTEWYGYGKRVENAPQSWCYVHSA